MLRRVPLERPDPQTIDARHFEANEEPSTRSTRRTPRRRRVVIAPGASVNSSTKGRAWRPRTDGAVAREMSSCGPRLVRDHRRRAQPVATTPARRGAVILRTWRLFHVRGLAERVRERRSAAPSRRLWAGPFCSSRRQSRSASHESGREGWKRAGRVSWLAAHCAPRRGGVALRARALWPHFGCHAFFALCSA